MKIFIIFSLCGFATSASPWAFAGTGGLVPGKREKIEVPKGTDTLTLKNAIQQTLNANGQLKALNLEIEARKAEQGQASLLPNPEVTLGFAEFAGNKERRSFSSAETSLEVSQEILLGRKRKRLGRLASLDTGAAGLDRDRLRLDLAIDVSKAFFQVLAAQERLELAREFVKLSTQTLQTVAAKVEAGKVSPLQETKAKVALTTAEVRLTQAELELASARQHLVTFWGESEPTFVVASGRLETLNQLPDLKHLTQTLSKNPDLVQLAFEKVRGQAVLDLERANGIPDLTVAGGVQRFQANNEQAFVLSFSLPLNLFNRNKGRIRAASNRIVSVEHRKGTVKTEITAQIVETYNAFKATHLGVKSLEEEVLPSAQWAFEAASEGYREGKFGFLEVLDAQRTLFQTKAEILDVLATYQTYRLEIQRLLGVFGPTTQNPLEQVKEGQDEER